MKSQKATGSILTTGDIRRLQEEIARDTKLREEASERISRNKAILDGHDAAVAGRAVIAKKPRKTVRKKPTIKITLKPKMPVTWGTQLHTETTKATPTKLPKGGGSVGIVLRVLRSHPSGLLAPDVKKIAITHPEASKSLREHGQYLYSILDTLEGRGEAVKGEDGKWRPNMAVASATAH